MGRAVALSRRGYPAPNPHVGCVLEKGGRIVGEGFHAYAGGPHAEVVALDKAGAQARGSTAYVTLEPCNHFGRTGPCSLALIEAGVSKVVFAVADPHPKASGGSERLRESGVRVESGLLESEAAAANRQFLFSEAHGRPFITLKAAASLDGRIALPSGESQWITGPAARLAARKLRAERGAVLVGRRTVELDDPELTARFPAAKNPPIRIVLDPQGSLSGDLKVFNEKAPTLRVVRPGLAGLEIPFDERFDLRVLASSLFERGIRGVLVEGGARTLAAFLEADLCDELQLFVGPVALGAGPSWLEGLTVARLADARRFELKSIRRIGPDARLIFEPRQSTI